MLAGQLLPPGPYALVRGYALTRRLGSLLAGCVVVLLVLMFGNDAKDEIGALLRDVRIAGATTRESNASWSPRPSDARSWKQQIVEHVLPTVAGTVAGSIGGEPVYVQMSLPLLWTRFEDLPPLVLVESLADGALSERVTTSWHLATRFERWLRLAVDLTVRFGLVWVVFWLARSTWRRGRSAARIAAHAIPWIGEARFEPAGNRWRLMVRWAGRDGESSTQVEQDPRHGGPFLVGPGKVLLLVDPDRPRSAIVLRQRLWPLRLPAATIDDVVARVAPKEGEEWTIPQA